MNTKPDLSSTRSTQAVGSRVVVVGSVNMDLVVRCHTMPLPGQTVSGEDFATFPGGKGANQAVAAARLGADCAMVGCVGDDAFGRQLRENLQREQVNVDALHVIDDTPSGVAVIAVDAAGENAITVVPGANGQLRPGHIDQAESIIAAASVMLVQLETPSATVTGAIELARRHGVRCVLDPAPAPPGGLDPALYQVDLISPNQTELAALAERPVSSIDQATDAARSLLKRGAGVVVVKLGKDGALIVRPDQPPVHLPAFPAEVMDTTAAGDAFTAALGVGLAEGRNLIESVRMGCAAGAVAVSHPGAQQAMPTRDQVERILGFTEES